MQSKGAELSEPDHLVEETRLRHQAEYATCQRRGHESSGAGFMRSDGSWSICKWCGTTYQRVVEQRTVELEHTTPQGRAELAEQEVSS